MHNREGTSRKCNGDILRITGHVHAQYTRGEQVKLQNELEKEIVREVLKHTVKKWLPGAHHQ
jgi:hypothetical protein